jgi:hypothetical protein
MEAIFIVTIACRHTASLPARRRPWYVGRCHSACYGSSNGPVVSAEVSQWPGRPRPVLVAAGFLGRWRGVRGGACAIGCNAVGTLDAALRSRNRIRATARLGTVAPAAHLTDFGRSATAFRDRRPGVDAPGRPAPNSGAFGQRPACAADRTCGQQVAPDGPSRGVTAARSGQSSDIPRSGRRLLHWRSVSLPCADARRTSGPP